MQKGTVSTGSSLNLYGLFLFVCFIRLLRLLWRMLGRVIINQTFNHVLFMYTSKLKRHTRLKNCKNSLSSSSFTSVNALLACSDFANISLDNGLAREDSIEKSLYIYNPDPAWNLHQRISQ